MPSGILTSWNEDRGFGFITPDDRGADMFAHIKDIVGSWEPEEGVRVTYEVVNDPRTGRARAAKVTPA